MSSRWARSLHTAALRALLEQKMGVQPSSPLKLSLVARGKRWVLASTLSRTVQLCCSSQPAEGVLDSELHRFAYVKQSFPASALCLSNVA